jgi:hypothetical protein
MRHSARYTEGGCGSAAPPEPDLYIARGSEYPPAAYPGFDVKVDLASLLPGGMTQDAEPGISRFLHAGSPEPVIGYGGTKGMFAYYQAVLHFGTPEESFSEYR